MNVKDYLRSESVSTVVWIVDNCCVMYFLSFCYEGSYNEWLDLDLFCSFYKILCWCYRKHIIIDLVHVDENRYIVNSVKEQGNLNRTQPYLPYPSFLRVQKPGSNTHPYYFRWYCDLCKRVTSERANSIGVCWQTLHTEPRSGPLKPTNGFIVGTGRRSLRKESNNDKRILEAWKKRDRGLVQKIDPGVHSKRKSQWEVNSGEVEK